MGLLAMDLFCGAGGFSHGFYQAGFDIALGIDYWDPALRTHERNGLGKTQKLDLLKFSIDDIVKMKSELDSEIGRIDVLMGSPPCTEFSYSKNGGGGDIKVGMKLVLKYLAFVGVFSPSYWFLENVPRLEKVLNEEFNINENGGWQVSFSDLGINRSIMNELGIEEDYLQIPVGKVLNATDYGTRQRRIRFIAGRYPISMLEKAKICPGNQTQTLRPIVESLNGPISMDQVEDPNYRGHFVKRSDIRDNCIRYLHPMQWEEARHQKKRHIQYGMMALPEDLDAPARTVLATHNISSRESFIIGTDKKTMYQGRMRKIYRQPSIREVASIQGFPLDFQLDALRLSERYRLVGNAVPCQLSYALAQSVVAEAARELTKKTESTYSSRIKETLRRQKENGGRPILPVYHEIMEEASDFHNGELNFLAKADKHLRRKMLSSKIRSSSSTVVFENTDSHKKRLKGGAEWKVCLQNGIGNIYSKVFLDENNVNTIIKAIDSSIENAIMKETIGQLIEQVDIGIPTLTDQWDQFTGFILSSSDLAEVIRIDERIELPGIAKFQMAFTNDVPDLRGEAGPIDLFDGMDAIMTIVFSNEEFKGLARSRVELKSLKSNPIYNHDGDSKIVWSIDRKRIPFITLAGSLMGIHVLATMYAKDESSDALAYHHSIVTANDSVIAWAKSNHKKPHSQCFDE